MIKVKICGLSRLQDIEFVNESLPDYIGFVFAESRRKVSFDQAERMKSLLDPRILSVGVFVNAPADDIVMLCRNSTIDLVQLHGDEDALYIKRLQSQIQNPLIKAVRVQNPEQIQKSQEFPCKYLLLDSYENNSYGGNGRGFDWAIIPQLNKPFFLAGGINSGNVKAAIELNPYCIDISSGVETDGVKDSEKTKEIITMIRSEN